MTILKKHNKKRNSEFVYEALIVELSKTVINKDVQKRAKIIEILKEFFNKNTELSKELSIYKSMSETKGIDKVLAEKIVSEAKRQMDKINKKKLILEKNNLVNKINKQIGKSIYKNFVPNYKTLATIYQIFNVGNNIKKSVLLEQNLVEFMSTNVNPEKEMKPIDNIVVNSFSKRFNNEYKNKLNKKQQQLINKYVMSFEDNGLTLKTHLNSEIKFIKENLSKHLKNEKFKENKDIFDKTQKVYTLFENFSKQNIDKNMIMKVLKTYDLLEEIKENEI